MKTSIITLSLALAGFFTIANAQERLDTSEAKKIAQLTRQNSAALTNAPLTFEADLDQPVALTDGDHGGLLIPRAQLSEGSESDVGVEPVAIGELWLYNLTLDDMGWVVGENKLDIISIDTNDGRVRAPRCVLGVRRPEGKSPEFLIFGKSDKPILTVPLKKIDKSQKYPLDMSADESGYVTVSILGKYQASFSVAELQL